MEIYGKLIFIESLIAGLIFISLMGWARKHQQYVVFWAFLVMFFLNMLRAGFALGLHRFFLPP